MLPITTLAALLWVALFLLPRASRHDDRFAVVCALVTLVLAGLVWFFMGVLSVF